MIEVRNLVKKYGDHVAVDHLNFTVEKGKIYGFLGPNGAGKTTTMNMITGYIASTEGDILIDGHNILEEPEEAKKKIGYLPELPPLYQDMTAKEYLEFAAELKGIPKEKRQGNINGVMSTTKIQNVKNRLIKNLSKGYKQRVGLAQALLGYPEIIILDEPTVGLDPKQIIEIRDLIQSLGEAHTVILSSHILSEVQQVCQTVLIISKGRLVACDTPDNLERLFAGSSAIDIIAEATGDQVRRLLAPLAAIEKLEILQEVNGRCSAQITGQPEEGDDLCRSIFFAFSNARLPLLRLNMARASLEDIFLELTSGETGEADGEEPDAQAEPEQEVETE